MSRNFHTSSLHFSLRDIKLNPLFLRSYLKVSCTILRLIFTAFKNFYNESNISNALGHIAASNKNRFPCDSKKSERMTCCDTVFKP